MRKDEPTGLSLRRKKKYLRERYARLSATDRENIDRQAKILHGLHLSKKKLGGIRELGELGALELLSAIGSFLNETE